MRAKLLLAVIATSTSIHIFSQAYNFPVRNGITMSTQWVDNLIIINNMNDEPLPAEKQMLYKHAESALCNYPERDFANLADNHRFQELCEKHDCRVIGGPMLGNISQTSVDIWVRTSKPDTVSVMVKTDKDYSSFGPFYTSTETDLSSVIKVTGLQPGKQYEYKLFVREKEIDIPSSAKIKTLPDDKDINTRILFGSCFHRFGLGNMNQTKTMISRNPDAFLGLGDIAVQDKNNSMGLHTLDFLARDLYPAWQQLGASIPVYALWDDHDYFDDDKWGIPKGYTEQDKRNVREIFIHSWCNPSYGFEEENEGVFFRTRIGAADVIMIDHRYFRTQSSFLGDRQMEWLEKQLLDCKGPFIILGGGTMWSDYVSSGKDSWGVYDTVAREKIFSLIEKNNIQGVLLISGDRHGSRGFKIPRNSGFNFYEFEVASLGGLGGQPATKPEWTTQFFGLNGGFAFGEFTFDTKPDDPTVTFRLISDSGEILHEMTLKRSELTPVNFK